MLPDKISFPYSERGSGRVGSKKGRKFGSRVPIQSSLVFHFSATIRPSNLPIMINQSEHSDLAQDYLVLL